MSGVSGLSVEFVELLPDHALIVVRGSLDKASLAKLSAGVEHVLDGGARYLVLDLYQVDECHPAAVSVLAHAARRLTRRRGWLRLVAASPDVSAALDTATLPDLHALYHAHNSSHDG